MFLKRLFKFVILPSLVIVLGFYLATEYLLSTRPYCHNWERDDVLSRQVACAEELPKEVLHTVSMLAVYVSQQPDPSFLEICDLFGLELITVDDPKGIVAILESLHAAPPAEDAQLTGPTLHLLLLDRQEREFGYLNCTLGEIDGREFVRIAPPGGGACDSFELAGLFREQGLLE